MGESTLREWETLARREVLDRQLVELLNEPTAALVSARYKKFRKMGQFFDLQS